MKIINLFKSIPFLTTLFLIIFLSINNQKVSANLRILFWSTPTSSLGTYIFISAGTGYILSYMITTKFSNNHKQFNKNKIKYKLENENEEEVKINPASFNDSFYDNTLIERDIKDPSPTINASFRVIGKTSNIDVSHKDNEQLERENSILYNEYDQQHYMQRPKYNNNVKMNTNVDDWDDYTYLNW